ncbi:MAG: uracil-DNA glycosylase [Clostridia bacterium]|nr:uracil-DNA glycosylase [Clostridia bacterium]
MQAKLELFYEKERQRLLALMEHDASVGEFLTPVFGEGPLSPKLMLIGEAPGGEESRLSHPFVGKAGKQLDALLCGAGICREAVFVTNSVKYRPTKAGARGNVNRTPTPNEVLDSLWLLREEILLVRPKVIATLGNTPLSAVLQLSGAEKNTIGALHGAPLELCAEGYPFLLFPLYHPASVIYNRKLLNVMEEDTNSLRSLLDRI